MSCIKSIQRGLDNGNKTITITKVDVTKSIALISGGIGIIESAGSWYGNGTVVPLIHLTSPTTLLISNAQSMINNGATNQAVVATYAWQVIEFA